ncbi:MAG: protein-disulfide reductase DsbD [Steroidobacteraceae bacterium]
MPLTARTRFVSGAASLAIAALFAVVAPAASAANAATLTTLASGSGDEFLNPDVAFRVGAEAVAPDRIEVTFQVHEGYYLYRGKMKFKAAEDRNAGLGTPDLPAGEKKTDEYFGEQEVYHHDVIARLPVSRGDLAPFTLPVKVTYQGCADAGLCYPPITKTFDVQMPQAAATSSFTSPGPGAGGDGFVSKQDSLASLIRDGNIFLMAGAFLLAGLALAFTPCVLPMVPIVAGIIAGEGANVTRGRAFSLSLAYVLGMAATYTAAGVAFAAAGQQAQTLFQQPWIILLFAALFIAMALSMFGLYTVQMPSFLQTRLSQLSNQQKAGSYAGVVVMGALSALIVTTCVGPALVAALSVIGQSGKMTRGGVALFSMAMGMGVPLLAVGASAGQLLPRAGAWMETVKQAFGAMMLAVAVWMLSRILPERVSLLLWIVPLAALAFILLRATTRTGGGRFAARLIGTAAAIYALLIAVGYFRGATDPLRPLQAAAAQVELPFERIKSVEDLNARVAAAAAQGKSVLLDFYADWCVSCKEMEARTFTQDNVRAALANTLWLQADVTANDATDQALLKHFGIYGPPTIAFYGADGMERARYRVVGFMKAAEFAPLAARAVAASTASQ